MQILNNPFQELDPDAGPFHTLKLCGELWKNNYSGKFVLTRVGAEVAWWCRHHDTVYYTQIGEEAANRYILYFSTKQDKDDFIAFFEQVRTETDPLIDNFATLKMDKFQAKSVTIMATPIWDYQSMSESLLDFWIWKRDNCVGQVWYIPAEHDLAVFEKEEDFALYKLKFQGAEKKKKPA